MSDFGKCWRWIRRCDYAYLPGLRGDYATQRDELRAGGAMVWELPHAQLRCERVPLVVAVSCMSVVALLGGVFERVVLRARSVSLFAVIISRWLIFVTSKGECLWGFDLVG